MTFRFFLPRFCATLVLGGFATMSAATSGAAPAHSSGTHASAAHGNSHAGAEHAMARQADASNLPALPPTVVIEECWVRAMPVPLPSGGYLQLHNRGDAPVTLSGAAAEPFGMTMLHATTTEDGVARMAMIPHVEVAAGTTLSLQPGGYHLMFEEPEGELTIGDDLRVQLHFDGYAPREVICEIRSARGESQR